jgi:hypothetical protein
MKLIWPRTLGRRETSGVTVSSTSPQTVEPGGSCGEKSGVRKNSTWRPPPGESRTQQPRSSELRE